MDRQVVIIGSGFAGSSTAFHLSRLGIRSLILERNEKLGGYFPTLEMQFPTNSCGVCFMKPDYPAYCPYIELERDENIETVTNADIKQIKKIDNGYKIIYEANDEVHEISSNNVVLASGYDTFDISHKPELGGGIYENVTSALDMEKLIYQIRAHMYDFNHKRIAYVQCVGSRDLRIGKPYCSSFCCMFAIKQAMLLKEIKPELDITIFYMDIRAFGKDYERYYNTAKAMGINFIRSAVAAIRKRPATGKLEILYTKNGDAVEDTFDFAVLSQGADFKKTTERLLKGLNINFDQFKEKPFENREIEEGLFIAGTAFEPMDIPDAVTDGAYIAALISERYDFKKKELSIPQIKHQKAKKIGIATINLQEEDYKRLREHFPEIINLKDLMELEYFIKENGIDGLCLVVDDIRLYGAKAEQNGNFGIHRDSFITIPLKTNNLIEEIRSAIQRIRSVQRHRYPVRKIDQRVAVVGGGLAGIYSALRLSRMGIDVTIIERSENLGGRLINLPSRKEFISNLIERVEKENKIEVLKGFGLKSFSGRFGDFKLNVESDREKRTINCGAIIIATGGEERRNVYGFEDNDRVFSFFDFEKRYNELIKAKTIVMLQCAGSRTEENPVCYRVCCTKAIENALKLKESNPDIEIYIIHKDVRTFGYRENLYRSARAQGISFIRMQKEPEVLKNNGLIKVKVIEEGTGEEFNINSDYMLLSTGIDPVTSEIKNIFNLETLDGFLSPYNKKSGLMDIKPGIYATGLCLNPLYTDDIIKQSEALPVRVAVKMLNREISMRFNTAFVNFKYCCGCELCIKACPVSARYMSDEEKIAVVDETLCEGCGTCAMVCANKASQHRLFEHKSMLKTIDYYI